MLGAPQPSRYSKQSAGTSKGDGYRQGGTISRDSNTSQDSYNKDPFNKHSYNKDPYNKDPYSREPYNKDPYNKDPYSKDPYTRDPCYKNPCNRDPNSKDPYNKDPYTRDSCNKDLYTRDPYNKDPCTRDPYNKDPCTRDPYNKDPCTRDPYNKDPCTRDPYNKDPSNKDSYNKDSHAAEHTRNHHADRYRHPEAQPGRRGSHRHTNGRGSETLGFIPGSADATQGRQACGSCTSLGWSSCKALICCVLTCGFYGSREPCLPVNESSTDHASKADPETRALNGLAMSNPTCGVPLEAATQPAKPSKLPTSDSFRYPDVRIAGQNVVYPSHTSSAPKRTRTGGKGDNQRPISNTSLYSREELDLDDLSDTGTDIDSLITKKLLELYALHQIDQLAKCTSDSSFSRKTNEISELIYSIAHDYNLEEQEAECRLVHGVIRISTRKGKKSRSVPHEPPPPPRANGRSDGTLPDSGNATMTYTSTFSDMEPEVKVSERTPSDELARNMRHYSGRLNTSSSSSFSPYHQDSEADSSGTPLIHIL